MSLAETGRMAPVARVRMRCASGERKRVNVMVLHVPYQDTWVLVHMFYGRPSEAGAGGVHSSSEAGHTPFVLEGLPGSETDAGRYGRLTSS